MALVIKGVNTGREVHVLDYIGPGGLGEVLRVLHNGTRYQIHVARTEGLYWWCEARAPLRDVYGNESLFGALPDHWLMPISPRPPLEVDVRKLEDEHEAPA